MICVDAIFPEINVAFARQDPPPEILVNPTNDAWYGYSSGPYQFLAIARMRAVEAGRAVVRPAYAGVSAVILPTGELAPGAIEVGPVDPDLAPDPQEPPRPRWWPPGAGGPARGRDTGSDGDLRPWQHRPPSASPS